MQRKPTHPGEMLREDFLPDYGPTVAGLAESLGVSRQSVNELLRERRAVSLKWPCGSPTGQGPQGRAYRCITAPPLADPPAEW